MIVKFQNLYYNKFNSINRDDTYISCRILRRRGRCLYISINKIKKETPTNIKSLVKMAGEKTSLRERFKEAPILKKWYWEKSPGIATKSDLQNLLFNKGNPKGNLIKVPL
jgi:hypothetical protein